MAILTAPRATRLAAHVALILAVASSVGTAQPAAQEASEASLKAAFLFNFTRFTTWPPEELAPTDPIDLCIADPEVASALEPMLAGKTIDGHGVTVRRLSIGDASGLPETLRYCELVYLGRADAAVAAGVLNRLKQDAVLTVGDREEFTQIGGVVRFFVERGRLRFEINTSAAERANLRISAKLLRLARITRD